MNRSLTTAVLLSLLLGCATARNPTDLSEWPVGDGLRVTSRDEAPPFQAPGSMTNEQMAWYVRKARAWFEAEFEQAPDGTWLRRLAPWGGRKIDDKRPPTVRVSRQAVNVWLPLDDTTYDGRYCWHCVRLEKQSGHVVASYYTEDSS